MGDLLDIGNAEITFSNACAKKAHQLLASTHTRGFDSCYVGQLICILVKCRIADDIVKKLKTPQPGRSPLLVNLTTSIKRQLAANVDVKCLVKPCSQSRKPEQEHIEEDWISCKCMKSLLSSFEPVEEDLKTEADLSEDKKFFIISVFMRVPDLPVTCNKAHVYVHVRPSSQHIPRWLSSPTKPEVDMLDEQEMDDKIMAGKRVVEKLTIIHPPIMKFQQKTAGNTHMICLSVRNMSRHSMVIKSCSIQPVCSPKPANKTSSSTESTPKRFVSMVCDTMVRLMTGDQDLLPTQLLPGEQHSFCTNINLTQLANTFTKEDVILEAHVDWSLCGNHSDRKTSAITTMYKLPSLRLKKGLFVVSGVCEMVPVKKGQSFTVNYSINNCLQDFLSIKLNWNPVISDESDPTTPSVEHVQKGLICLDPCIQLGACQYGETVTASVSFLALRTGLYEVCKHMKVNLRYLIPGSDNSSLASPTSITSALSDDPLMLNTAFEGLWKSTGSRSSFHDSSSSLQEPKVTYKSSSYTDLSQDRPDELFVPSSSAATRSPLLQRKEGKGSSMTAAQYEQLLLCPGNFIKNSCLVKVI